MQLHYSNNMLKLPGTFKPSKSGRFKSDLLFFVVALALPSSFFALIDFQLIFVAGLFDYRLLFILVTIPYLIKYAPNLLHIARLPAGKMLIAICVYILLVMITSKLRGISTREIITIMRINFTFPVICMGLLAYAVTMDLPRLFRFFRWIFYAMFFQAILYIISNLLGVEIFSAKGKDPIEYEGQTLYQNTFAIPHLNATIFCIAYLSTLVKTDKILTVAWAVAITVIVLAFVRNQIAVYAMYFLIVTTLGTIYINKIKFSKALSSVLFLAFLSLMVIILFPSHIDRLIGKFGGTLGDSSAEFEEIDTGTFDLRTDAIKFFYFYLLNKGTIFFGEGYKREDQARIGEYSFVMGADTLIPPFMITEGMLGLILRILPLLVLLYVNLRGLRSKRNRTHHLYCILAISLIIPELINIVQTQIFAFYHRTVFVLFLLEIIKFKHRRWMLYAMQNKTQQISLKQDERTNPNSEKIVTD